MRDHPPLVINEFRGTFDRGEDEVVPPGYFISSLNWKFTKNGVITRGGTRLDNLHAAIPLTTKFVRVELYERTGEAQRLLMLDNVGQLWDSVTGVIILSIPAMTDFGCTVMFDRAYISPHDGNTGLPGEVVYLYEGSNFARPAAGDGPSVGPPIVVADSALSGKCEVGVHVFAVSFETSSGYISPPGGFASFSPVGEHQLDISSIPAGPPGTVARVLFSTKIVETPTSDPKLNTFYFIPEGRIPDNTNTIKTVDYFDADLMEEASYLLEGLAEIPAGVGIGQYKSSLIVWGEDANSAIIRVSHAGEPESHNGVDGFVTVYPGIGGGVKNCTEYRNQLLIFKSRRVYSTQDNDNEPAFWDIGEVDGSIGAECHGIGTILNIGTNVEDRLFVADRSGLRLFLGTFTDDSILTFNIDDIWARITKTAFRNVEVSIDATNALIYCAVPLDGATTPNFLLFGDYSEGLSESEIKWTAWSFPVRPTTIVISLVNGLPILKVGSIDGYVFKQDESEVLDNGQRIECACKFPLFPVGTVDEQVNHATGITLRARGVGVVNITAEGLDGANKIFCQSLILSPLPGKPLFRGFNFVHEHCSVTLELAGAGAFMNMTKFILYMAPLWESRTQVS